MLLSRSLQRLLALSLVLIVAVVSCSAPAPTAPVVTLAPATFTPIAVPATATPAQPTATSVPPTATTQAATETAVPPTQEPASVTAGDLVNVRSGPGIDYDLLGQLTAGQTVAAVGRNADSSWWQIAFTDAPEGKGWVLGSLVTASAAAANLPEVQAPVAPTATLGAPPATEPPAAPTATSAPSASYPAPTLDSPNNGVDFRRKDTEIWLRWESVGALRPGDCYQVRIVHKDGPYDSECVTDTAWLVQEWLFDYRPENRKLQWSVRIVDEAGNQVSPWSETRWFYWFGA